MFKLKIVILPLSLALTMMLGFTMIWPKYIEVKVKREELSRLQAEREKAEIKIKNASALSEDLANSVREESLVLSMLPESKQEEKLLGGIYHIASDSGVTLINITWTDIPSMSKIVAGKSSGSKTAVSTAGDYSALQVTASFGGKYQNIRSLISQLNILGRMKYISEFGIQRSKKIETRQTEIGASGEAVGNDLPGEELLFQFKAYFGYAPKSMMLSGAPLEVFQSSEINFSSIDMFSSFIPLEDVYVGDTGKNNLFSPEN